MASIKVFQRAMTFGNNDQSAELESLEVSRSVIEKLKKSGNDSIFRLRKVRLFLRSLLSVRGIESADPELIEWVDKAIATLEPYNRNPLAFLSFESEDISDPGS